MVPNEDEEGDNVYAGSYEERSIDAMERKRDVVKERKISPMSFNSVHRTSSIHDDKVRARSLNQYNAK